MAQTPSLSQQWDSLKADFLDRCKALDAAAPWSEREPRWWLDMQAVERAILNTRCRLEGNHTILARVDETLLSYDAAVNRQIELEAFGYEVTLKPLSNEH